MLRQWQQTKWHCKRCGQKVVYGHVTTNNGRRILIQITCDVMNVRKPLLSTSARKRRGVTIIFNHDCDRIIFRNETVNLISHDCDSHLHVSMAIGVPLWKAMVMAGENVANDVDEEVYVNDGVEGHEAQEASAGDRRAIADADQAGQLYNFSGATRAAKTLRTPEPPTDAARVAHKATHVPFRDWCPFCVASRERSSPTTHRALCRSSRRIACSFEQWQRAKLSHALHSWKKRSGVVISFMCDRKAGYEDLTKEILRHFEAYGLLNPVILQCDREMSIIDVCRKVARERNARTVLRFAPKQVLRATGLSKQCTDTFRDSHDAPRHKSRRPLAYCFQQFHMLFHLQFGTLDL